VESVRVRSARLRGRICGSQCGWRPIHSIGPRANLRRRTRCRGFRLARVAAITGAWRLRASPRSVPAIIHRIFAFCARRWTPIHRFAGLVRVVVVALALCTRRWPPVERLARPAAVVRSIIRVVVRTIALGAWRLPTVGGLAGRSSAGALAIASSLRTARAPIPAARIRLMLCAACTEVARGGCRRSRWSAAAGGQRQSHAEHGQRYRSLIVHRQPRSRSLAPTPARPEQPGTPFSKPQACRCGEVTDLRATVRADGCRGDVRNPVVTGNLPNERSYSAGSHVRGITAGGRSGDRRGHATDRERIAPP
jgi:hypothetical protein